MEGLLQGIPHVAIYLDDIAVTGVDKREHLKNLEEVLTRMEKAGLRLRKDKCSFLQRQVQYPGHRVDAQGLHPLESKEFLRIESFPEPLKLLWEISA